MRAHRLVDYPRSRIGTSADGGKSTLSWIRVPDQGKLCPNSVPNATFSLCPNISGRFTTGIPAVNLPPPAPPSGAKRHGINPDPPLRNLLHASYNLSYDVVRSARVPLQSTIKRRSHLVSGPNTNTAHTDDPDQASRSRPMHQEDGRSEPASLCGSWPSPRAHPRCHILQAGLSRCDT